VKETNAIFANLQQVHQRAAGSETTLPTSFDAKAPVLIGPFSRGGKSRRGTKGADHDFKPWGKLTPFGLFLPDYKDLSLYFTPSKVTSDFIVDRLDQWWQEKRPRYPKVDTLLRCCWIWTTDRRTIVGAASSSIGWCCLPRRRN
jgi:hypothetical protein